MKIEATDYHGENETFATGDSISHVTDTGDIVTGTITGISDGLLDVAFDDGESGSVTPKTCYRHDAPTPEQLSLWVKRADDLAAGVQAVDINGNPA